MKDSLLKKVLSTISHFGMLQEGDSVLISISGGPDSVFLASCLNQIKGLYNLKLFCFHLDHKTRNGQSSKDAVFVKNFCESNGLKLFAEEVDVKSWCRQNRLSFQDGARTLRLDLLNKTAQKNRIQKISTGHTADDNAETFLMHLLRGSGLRGLSGIQPVSGHFIRPLLEVFHDDILEYLSENEIPYCSDKTNMENIYYRNKVRNILIPFINTNFSKKFVKNLSSTIEVIRQENAFIDAYGRECLQNIAEIIPVCSEAVPCKNGATCGQPVIKGKRVPESKDWTGAPTESRIAETIKIPLADLRAYPESVIKRIIISALELVNGNFTNIRRENIVDITKLCFSGNERKELMLAGGIAVVRESENLFLHNSAAQDSRTAAAEESSGSSTVKGNSFDFNHEIDKQPEDLPEKTVNDSINIKLAQENVCHSDPGMDIRIEIGSKQCLKIGGIKYLIEAFLGGPDFLNARSIKSSEAFLDFEKIRFPVMIDYWHKKGERFVPLGIKDFKKIQDYFTDMKIPYSKRLRVPLLCDQEKIIWVGNYRIDDRVKIDEQTKKIFHIKIIDI